MVKKFLKWNWFELTNLLIFSSNACIYIFFDKSSVSIYFASLFSLYTGFFLCAFLKSTKDFFRQLDHERRLIDLLKEHKDEIAKVQGEEPNKEFIYKLNP